jgi:site-specific DNA-methyltransferase (adenine-specific)
VTPYYADDLVTIYHGDARGIAPTLTGIEAVVSDPPYGMGWDTDTRRFAGGSDASRRRRGVGRQSPRVVADDMPFDPTPWLEYGDVILWGSNHFAATLPRGTTLVWLKRLDAGFGSFLSDAELAWQKGGHGVYCHRDLSMAAEARSRVHPTQKPVGLMRWCVARTRGTVLDPFMGSGSTLVAAKDAGRRAIGIEIEERYCEIAARRCSQEVLGLVA